MAQCSSDGLPQNSEGISCITSIFLLADELGFISARRFSAVERIHLKLLMKSRLEFSASKINCAQKKVPTLKVPFIRYPVETEAGGIDAP